MKSIVIATLIASSILVAVVVVVGLATAATATAASSGVAATNGKDETFLQRRLGRGPGRRNLNPRGRILNSQQLYQDRRALNTDVKTETDTVKTASKVGGDDGGVDDGASAQFDCSDGYTATNPYV